MNPFTVNRQQFEQEIRQPGRVLVVLPVTPITATSAGAAQTLLTVNDDKFFEVSAMKICNRTGTAATFTMHIVEAGDVAGNGNTLYSAESIPPNDTVTLAERNTIFASAGSSFQVHSGTASALNIMLAGLHIQSGEPL